MIEDQPANHPLVHRETVLPGLVVDIRRDVFTLDDEQVTREYVLHPGAVGIIALNDLGQMLLVEQYRHPISTVMWEPPAGLLDVADEDPLIAAKRELLEETGYVAQQWDVLFDFANSPGGSSEQLRCYLAQGVSEHPDGRPVGDAEERNMPVHWVPIAEVLAGIGQGKVTHPLLVTGTFALLAAMADPDSILRPADAPWPARDIVLEHDRVRLPR